MTKTSYKNMKCDIIKLGAEKMFLDFTERLILTLYAEFYQKPYDSNDSRKYPHYNAKINHTQIQNIIYIFKQLGIYIDNNIEFTWSPYGPYSQELAKILKRMDKKQKQIVEYYSDYNSSRKMKLSLVLFEEQIQKLNLVISLVLSVTEKEYGGELIGMLAYISRRIYLGESFKTVNAKLKDMNSIFEDDELNKAAWNALVELNLVPRDTKSPRKLNCN